MAPHGTTRSIPAVDSSRQRPQPSTATFWKDHPLPIPRDLESTFHTIQYGPYRFAATNAGSELGCRSAIIHWYQNRHKRCSFLFVVVAKNTKRRQEHNQNQCKKGNHVRSESKVPSDTTTTTTHMCAGLDRHHWVNRAEASKQATNGTTKGAPPSRIGWSLMIASMPPHTRVPISLPRKK